MILARLATAIRQQNWSQIFIEVLIVVIGIFLGLQVQAWYEGREARIAEQEVVGYLISDMEATIEYMARRDAFSNTQIANIGKLLDLLEGEKLAPGDVPDFERAIRVMGMTVALDAFITSFHQENINRILDSRMRRIIDGYLGRLNRIKSIIDNTQVRINDARAITMKKTAESPLRNGDRKIFYDFESLRQDSEFRAVVITIYSSQINYQNRYQQVSDYSKLLLDALKSYQADGTIMEVTFQ